MIHPEAIIYRYGRANANSQKTEQDLWKDPIGEDRKLGGGFSVGKVGVFQESRLFAEQQGEHGWLPRDNVEPVLGLNPAER